MKINLSEELEGILLREKTTTTTTTTIKVIDMQSPVKWFYRNGCNSSQAQFVCIQAKAFMQAIFVMKFDFSQDLRRLSSLTPC